MTDAERDAIKEALRKHAEWLSADPERARRWLIDHIGIWNEDGTLKEEFQ